MPELKVDAIVNLAGSGKPNLPVAPTVGSNAAISTLNTHSYTSSGTEPSTPKNGALWWDSANDKVMVYINSEFKEIDLNSSSSSGPVWGGTRGFIVGGADPNDGQNTIDYFDLTTAGNTSDFGDLSIRAQRNCSGSNGTRSVNYLGEPYVSGGSLPGNSIDYFACATTGNATDFGDSINSAQQASAVSNGTRMCVSLLKGSAPTSASASNFVQNNNEIEYLTIDTAGNTQDFGDLTVARSAGSATNDETRGVFVGGWVSPNPYNTMDYITIATTGNATDFGDSQFSWGYLYGSIGQVGNNTIGCWAGGYQDSGYAKANVISKITIQTTGNATDFGDLLAGQLYMSACSDGTTGTFAGGSGTASHYNVIHKITIGTPGNATDFGDISSSARRQNAAGVSGNAS